MDVAIQVAFLTIKTFLRRMAGSDEVSPHIKKVIMEMLTLKPEDIDIGQTTPVGACFILQSLDQGMQMTKVKVTDSEGLERYIFIC